MDVQAGFEALRSFTPGPFKVVKTYDVRYLTDGRFTLQIAFTGGFGLEHQYSTQRWVLVQIGETYLLDTWYPGKKFVPDDWTQQEVAVNLSGGALALADGSISLETETSDVIFLSITTTDAQAPIGLYRLNEGVAPVAGLAEDSGELYGILSADASVVLDYGFADVEPGQYALVSFGTRRSSTHSGRVVNSIVDRCHRASGHSNAVTRSRHLTTSSDETW